jgi:hypothetical protein
MGAALRGGHNSVVLSVEGPKLKRKEILSMNKETKTSTRRRKSPGLSSRAISDDQATFDVGEKGYIVKSVFVGDKDIKSTILKLAEQKAIREMGLDSLV